MKTYISIFALILKLRNIRRDTAITVTVTVTGTTISTGSLAIILRVITQIILIGLSTVIFSFALIISNISFALLILDRLMRRAVTLHVIVIFISIGRASSDLLLSPSRPAAG